MKKILLTGGKGFFASRFKSYYNDKYEVISLSHNELNILDLNNSYNTISHLKPSYVIHSAALADTVVCQNNPQVSYEVNVKGTENIAKSCSAAGAKLIFLSSDQIFNGNVGSGPFSEDDLPIPNTVYGTHKLQAEEIIRKIYPESWILRLTWMYGFPEKNCRINSNIFWNCIISILQNKKISLPTNEYRGMTYVYDLVERIPQILNIPYGTYHTGSKNNFSTYEVGRMVFDALGRKDDCDRFINMDVSKFGVKPRDLRITNEKLTKYGINFPEIKTSISRCCKDFSF